MPNFLCFFSIGVLNFLFFYEFSETAIINYIESCVLKCYFIKALQLYSSFFFYDYIFAFIAQNLNFDCFKVFVLNFTEYILSNFRKNFGIFFFHNYNIQTFSAYLPTHQFLIPFLAIDC